MPPFYYIYILPVFCLRVKMPSPSSTLVTHQLLYNVLMSFTCLTKAVEITLFKVYSIGLRSGSKVGGKQVLSQAFWLPPLHALLHGS